jgi:hypothetical protein
MSLICEDSSAIYRDEEGILFEDCEGYMNRDSEGFLYHVSTSVEPLDFIWTNSKNIDVFDGDKSIINQICHSGEVDSWTIYIQDLCYTGYRQIAQDIISYFYRTGKFHPALQEVCFIYEMTAWVNGFEALSRALHFLCHSNRNLIVFRCTKRVIVCFRRMSDERMVEVLYNDQRMCLDMSNKTTLLDMKVMIKKYIPCMVWETLDESGLCAYVALDTKNFGIQGINIPFNELIKE